MEQIRKKFFTDVTFISVLTVLTRLRGLILLPLIARLIGLKGYGVWLQVSLTVGLMGNVFEVGLHSALARFIPSVRKKEEIADIYYSILSFTLSFGIIAALLVCIFADPIASLSLRLVEVSYLFRIASILIPLNLVILMQQNYFRAKMRLKLYSSLDVLVNFGDVLGIVIVLLSGFGLREMFYAVIFWRSILSLAQAIMIWKDIGLYIPRFKNFKKLLAFSLPLVPSTITGNIVKRLDRYLIGYFLGVSSVGLYGAASMLGELLDIFTVPLRKALIPYLANFWDRKQFEEVKLYLGYSIKGLLFFAVPTAIGITAYSKNFMNILTTPEFQFPNLESLVFLLALATVFFSFNRILNQVFIIQKKTIAVPIMQTIEATFSTILNIVLIPIIGLIGAAVSRLASYFLAFLIRRIYIIKKTTIDPTTIYSHFAIKCLIASLIMGATSFIFHVSGILGFIGVILFSIFLYLLILWIFRTFQSNEIEFIKGSFRFNRAK